MNVLGNALTVLVAILHFGFMVLEMFFWNHPVGQKMFSMTPEVAASSAVLAANQGLYNGLLGTGLIWAVLSGKRDVKLFFLGCVIVAGIFGGITAKPTIFFVQALPALIAFVLVWMSASKK